MATEMEDGDNDLAEEGWKDDDFLSFGNASDEKSKPKREEQSTTDETSPATTNLENALPPWMDQPTNFRRVPPLVALHNEIVGFCKLMAPMPEEMEQRNALVERFKGLAHKTFGADKCEVAVFGSQATGLCLPSSDIDIVINVSTEEEEMKEGDEKQKSQESGDPSKEKGGGDDKDEENGEPDDEAWKNMRSKSPLEQLADTIRDEWKDEISYLEVIPNTKIPLVKLTHAPTGLSVDVSFVKETGPQAAVLMKTFMEALPPLRPLIFVLKYFLAARVLNEPYSGGVGSYMLQLMIVSFLQHRERDFMNFGNPAPCNLGCLLLEFLELYGTRFNYCVTGISVRHDGSYFRKGDRKDPFVMPSRPYSLAMENPLDINTDVGKASFRIQMVQRSFFAAYKVLMAHVSHPAQPTVSILATIMPPVEEMVHRKNAKMGASGQGASEEKPANGEESYSPQKKKRRFR